MISEGGILYLEPVAKLDILPIRKPVELMWSPSLRHDVRFFISHHAGRIRDLCVHCFVMPSYNLAVKELA